MTQPEAHEDPSVLPEPAVAAPTPSGGAVAARKILVGFALVVVFGGGYYLLHKRSKGPLEIAYAGNRKVIIWSTTAQVRQPVVTVDYGVQLDVLERDDDQLQVRTPRGIVGWVDEHDVLSADLWLKAKDLVESVAQMPIQAQGHTRVLSNLHILPGRDSVRIRQLDRDIPVDLYLRKALDVPGATSANDAEGSSVEPATQKKEDWWLIRAHTSDSDAVAGWVLGRFLSLDVPEPLPDYASSADLHIISWAVLNQVRGADGKLHTQYLVLATRGGEGQPCDFTALRGYTWGLKSQRYETAYVEDNLCGMLPLHMTSATTPGGDAAFSFTDTSEGKSSLRTYHMHQTIIRHERAEGEPAHPGKRER